LFIKAGVSVNTVFIYMTLDTLYDFALDNASFF
jgi:hypothetical protein